MNITERAVGVGGVRQVGGAGGRGGVEGGGEGKKGLQWENRVLVCEYMCLCACADGCVPVRADKSKQVIQVSQSLSFC